MVFPLVRNAVGISINPNQLAWVRRAPSSNLSAKSTGQAAGCSAEFEAAPRMDLFLNIILEGGRFSRSSIQRKIKQKKKCSPRRWCQAYAPACFCHWKTRSLCEGPI